MTFVALITGLLLAVQWRSQEASRSVLPSRRIEDLVVLLKTTEKANSQLSEQVRELQGQLTKAGTSRPAGALVAASQSHDYPALVGPGLIVTVAEGTGGRRPTEGNSAVVHAEDLLKIINELRTGGGEAISLNGHRITELSEVVTAGQHIMVNQTPVKGPYKIRAIGPTEDMKTTLGLRGGVVEYLQFYGISVDAVARKRVEVAGYKWKSPWRFAQPSSRSMLRSPPPAF
ncbi:MAG: DUF881 domain-containing protein [Candidatus Sericytochromatia bacterium]|nr:DUF881 domain-containing protein [Candidatus Sericytochromatia bacterium]